MPARVVDISKASFSVTTSDGTPLTILRDIDLVIEAGEAVAIEGPSGAGKTTLLMLVAGLLKATSGKVVVAGEDLSRLDEDQLALMRRHNVGIVFQTFNLIPSLTALENVSMALEITEPALPIAEIERRAGEILKHVGLGHRLTHLPSALSGGERQRVSLARALVTQPALLLADEPTGNLDQTTGAMVIELMFRLARELGTTVLLITHDPALAAEAGQRFAMNRGHLAPIDAKVLA